MWKKLKFGKHEGKTLPQVILSDPDWFFWAIEKNTFDSWGLRNEANDIRQKASQIKIPKPNPENWEIEYFMTLNQEFERFAIVRATKPNHVGSSITSRADHLDLFFVTRIKGYQKGANNRMLDCFRHYYFGGANLTKARREKFFDNPDNFVAEEPAKARLHKKRRK